MGDDPPYLAVGTEVSAKYKGAFCEAKIRKVVRTVKCKVTFKSGLGSTLVSDDQIKGTLRVGANVEAKHPDKNTFIDATINKIQDCSQYTVVFDDGDITTLRRSALCLKSGRHFNESETLDQLPLTHPEHFSNPVVGGRRGVRRRNINTDNDKEDSSDDEDVPTKKGRKKNDKEADMGKVVCVESTDKKKTKDAWFPALIVSPSAQETVRIRTKDDYLVRSFRDGRYYTVPKKETKDFKESGDKYESNSNVLRTAVEKATNYLEKNELPPHWDREILFGHGNTVNEESNNSDEQQTDSDSSEDDPTEDKDRFVAQLYKFMDDRGTPINKVPLVCNKDLDLYKLYKIVKTHGGYNKVTNGSQWKSVTIKMGYGAMPSTSTINLVKQSYKKCVYHYEEFNRKLGCTMNARAAPTTKSRSSRQFFREKHASGSTKDIKKEEPEETVKKEEEKDKKSVSSGDIETEPPVSDSETKKSEPLDDSRRSRSRQESRSRTKEPEEVAEKQPKTPIKKKRVSLKEKEKEPVKEEPSSPAAPPKKGGRGKKKETEEETEKSEPEEVLDHIPNNVHVDVGHKLLVYYGPQSEKKVVYEAKVLKLNLKTKSFLVHYTGWNTRYDEWIKRGRISENLTFKPDQGKPAQGRGPAGYAETTESESSSSTKVSTKSPKRKPRAIPSTPTAASGTRSKSGITRRKRFSGESEIIKRRKTRQKSDQVVAIPSVSGSDAESSDSEDKTAPIVSTPPSSVSSASSAHVSKVGNLEKRNEDDDASSSSTSSSSIIKLTKDNGEKDKDKQNQVIDLNQIRSEMKGLDKMVKSSSTPTPPAVPTPPPPVSELKLDIYDFQDDTVDAPKLKMFAPRSPDKKEDKPESVPPVNKAVVSPDIVDQCKGVSERERETRQSEAESSATSTSSSTADTKDIKLESVAEAEKIKEEDSRPATPQIMDTEPSEQQTPEVQASLADKPPVSVSTPTPKVKQTTHILKVATPTKSKGSLSQSPRQKSPVAAVVAHPPPPPLVRSSGVIVAPKPMVAPLVQVRPPMLIQRPPASLAPGSLVRLAVAGPQEIPVRLPGKIEPLASVSSASLKAEGKAGTLTLKQQDFPHSTPDPGIVLPTSTQSSVNPGVEAKDTVSTKLATTVLSQGTSETVTKPTSFTPKVGSAGKEKKHVVVTQLIDSTIAMASSLASSQATPTTSSAAKKKTKKIISKKFVESESDSSTEAQAESPKKVVKRRQRSETPKKGPPPAKKKKLELQEGSKPVTPVKRAVKGRPPNKKAATMALAKSEAEKSRTIVPANVPEERSEKSPEKIDERIQVQLSPDIIERVIERSPVKQEKYFERLEKHVDKYKNENVDKDSGPKQSKQMEKKERENAEKESGSKQIKHSDKKDQVTENLEKDVAVTSKENKDVLVEDKPTAQVEKQDLEVEKKVKLPEKKEVEKPVDKKEKSSEKKEKLLEKHVDKKEKNVDKKEKIAEKNTEKKEKNVEKQIEKKEKNIEKHFDKKEKLAEKILDKKDKPVQKMEKSFEKKEKGAEKKHPEKKEKKTEKGLDKKEKSLESEKKVEKKEKAIEVEKKIDKKDKTVEKEKVVEKKEKESEKDKVLEKSEKVVENVDKSGDKSKNVDNSEKIPEKVKETVLKQEKLIDKPGKHVEKQGKKLDKPNKSTIDKPTKQEKLSKSFEKQKHLDKPIKNVEIEVPEKPSKLSEKQSKESEKVTKQFEKRDKLPEKQLTKKEIKKEREILNVNKDASGPTLSVPLDSKSSIDSDTGKKSAEQLPIKEESKNTDLPIRVESKSPDLPLTNPCSVDLSGSAKALEKIPILPTISVTIPSKVMSLNLVELTDKKLETPTLFFASKAVDISSGKTEESVVVPDSSPFSPVSSEKEEPMSLVSDEVIAKSPEPDNENQMENARLKSSEKQDMPVQDDLPCGLLLCEEIIPGSPAAGDDSSRFSFEDELSEEKTSKGSNKSANVVQSKNIEIPVEDETNSRFGDGKPEEKETEKSESVALEEKRTRSLILEKEDTSKSASEEQRNSFNTQQDTPQSIETTPPMTPEISSGSSISSGSPRIDADSQSPLAARGSSKSKESSDGDEDLSEFPKGNDNEDNYLSNETVGKTSKASNSSMSTSTKRTRLSEPRNSRNVSPPAKRRRIIRRKSPEEVVRSYPYRGRSSTGRKSQTGMTSDSQDHHKTMPPPPPINLGRPPRSSRFINFIPELDSSMDSEQRIELINQAIQDLREKYASVKSEMLSFERRRKRWKRREREKAAAERAARQEASRLNS